MIVLREYPLQEPFALMRLPLVHLDFPSSLDRDALSEELSGLTPPQQKNPAQALRGVGVDHGGVEPPTSDLRSQRSSHLS